MWLPHLVVLLLDFEDLLTRLLIQPVDFVLHLIYPLYRILLVFVCKNTTIAAGAFKRYHYSLTLLAICLCNQSAVEVSLDKQGRGMEWRLDH